MVDQTERTKWVCAELLGQLFIEEILIISNEPALFVCVDGLGARYLTVLLDDEDELYLLARVTKAALLAMLNGEVSMEQTFRAAEDGKAYMLDYRRDGQNKGYRCQVSNMNSVSADNLPDVGAMFTLKNKKILRYIKQIQG